MSKPYDEEAVLTRYVWTHYLTILTDEEKMIGGAIFWREKAVNASGGVRDMILKRRCELDNPRVEEALINGVDFYRDKVRHRILQDHPDQVFINRCPKCAKVVGTPKARLCKWCHHKWFDEP